jgi:ATP-grasp domain
MLILLSDGSGLASRQSATLLAAAGHQVEALSPDPLCLCRMTRKVRKVHRVPAVGADPFGWLAAALDVATQRRARLLLPVQEQVTVMSLARKWISDAGLLTAVPDFEALVQVQDKVSAYRTMARLGLPQPHSYVVTSADELAAITELPAFVKMPIGTASAGVRRVATPEDLRQLTEEWLVADGGVLVQRPVAGPLAMVQSVFANGELVAFHACERVREGAGGGASHKRGIPLPAARGHLSTLGAALGWHGALSADVILSADGPLFIDINPRLVEPVNAFRSGVDLTGAMVEVAQTGTVTRPQPPGRDGMRTHQLLIAILGAAQHGSAQHGSPRHGSARHGGRRRDVVQELWQVLVHGGLYRSSTEELTPVWRCADPLAALPVVAAAAATLISPPTWRHFTGDATSAYALTPAAWQGLLDTWRGGVSGNSGSAMKN